MSTTPLVVVLTLLLLATIRELLWELKSLALSCWFTLFSQRLTLRRVPVTPMSLCWLHFLLGSLCSWFTWLPSPSLELESTLLGVLVLLLSSTMRKLGMIIGFSELVYLLELLQQLHTISTSLELQLSRLWDPSAATPSTKEKNQRLIENQNSFVSF
ncbi:hypothetical protein REPUB_Repub11eG0085900 [Reevesia pubescens]